MQANRLELLQNRLWRQRTALLEKQEKSNAIFWRKSKLKMFCWIHVHDFFVQKTKYCHCHFGMISCPVPRPCLCQRQDNAGSEPGKISTLPLSSPRSLSTWKDRGQQEYTHTWEFDNEQLTFEMIMNPHSTSLSMW